MPETREPRAPDFVDFEKQPFSFFGQNISDNKAAELVQQTFQRYESWRRSNHDHRWMENDRLYLGDVPKRVWEGTNVPRANLGIPITFDQIQTAYPLIVGELFSQVPYWFDVEATPFSTPEEAHMTQAALAYQLDSPQDMSGKSALSELKLSVLEVLQHGNGAIEIGWNFDTGQLKVEHVPLRDLYFDPSLTSPRLDDAQVVIRRKNTTIQELERLRGAPNFNLPPRPVMNFFAKNRSQDAGDQILQQFATLRGENAIANIAAPGSQPDPALQEVELLQYWTNDRIIWTIGRRWTVLNIQNPWGFKPFAMAPLFHFLGRAYGMSIPDMLEGEQKLIQGFYNARIDEMSLAIQPPVIRPSDSPNIRTSKYYPGAVDSVQSPKDMLIAFPNDVTGSIFNDIAAAEQRATRRVGINQMAQTGLPTPSNANRTATGVQRQASFTLSRLRPIIENIEDFLVVPLLYKAHTILNIQTDGLLDQIAGIGEQKQMVAIPREVLNQPVRFKMTAASRMISRERLAPFMQTITGVLTSDPIIQAAASQGLKPNLLEWDRFIQEASGTSDVFDFWTQMTPEEQQQAQQPPPEVIARLQEKQMDAQLRQSIADAKNQTELQTALIEAQARERTTGENSAAQILKLLIEERLKREELKIKREEAKKKNDGSTGTNSQSR